MTSIEFNPIADEVIDVRNPSRAARERMRSSRGEPFLLADWVDVLMCHLEVDPVELQGATPYAIDCFCGKAYVSLVFFLLRRMRPRLGGRWTEWLLYPLATHPFLNVRTYVQHNGEPGIFFLTEWLPNPLSVLLGPRVFGLPYRRGHFTRANRPWRGTLDGAVTDALTGAEVGYTGTFDRSLVATPCEIGSLEEWLMERYTAFTHQRDRWGFFRVWHRPWPQVPADVKLTETGLLTQLWPWMAEARWAGAAYSLGFDDVWMGRPQSSKFGKRR